MSQSAPFAAWRSRPFAIVLSARFCVSMAIEMTSVAVGYALYAATHRALDLGLVGLSQFLPVFALSIVSGNVADRVDRRTVLTACYALFAAVSVAFFVVGTRAQLEVRALYALLVGFGVARAFAAPSGQAWTAASVPRDDLANAMSWSSFMWCIASVAGPALGGVLLASTGGARAVHVLAATLFACGVLLVRCARAPGVASRGNAATWREALGGLSTVWRSPLLLGSISLDFVAVFLGGVTALLPMFASDVLHVGALGLGALRAAPAVGAGSMAIVLTLRPLDRGVGHILLACVGLFGACTVVFGLSTSLPLSLCMLAMLGAADMVSVVVRHALLQLATPPEMSGRVNAVNAVFIGASNELGELESGLVAAVLGPVGAVVVGGIGTIAVVVAWALRFPALRDVDRLRPDEVSTS